MISTSQANQHHQHHHHQQQQQQQQQFNSNNNKNQQRNQFNNNNNHNLKARLINNKSNHLIQSELDQDDDLDDDEDDDEDDDDQDEDDDDDEDDDLYINNSNQINYNNNLSNHHQQQHQQHQHQQQQQQQQQNLNNHHQNEVDDDTDRASDSSFSDSVSLSSTPSIPCSDDIDFTLVYALHTFLATVEGQASVVKGDQLTLLDDKNSYWWLIKVLKTQAIGYIPAENIETPYERLARLNKHRNVDLSSATQIDHEAGAISSLAQTRFAQRIPCAGDPVRSRSPQDRRKGPAPPPMIGPGNFSRPPVAPAPGTGKGKTVAFTAPTYFENSGNEWSEDGEGDSGDEQMLSGDDMGDGDWDGEGEYEEGEEGFEDEEEDSEDEDDDDDDHSHLISDGSTLYRQPSERSSSLESNNSTIKLNTPIDSQRQLQEQLAQEHKQQQLQQLQQQQQQQQQQHHQQQQQQQQQQQHQQQQQQYQQQLQQQLQQQQQQQLQQQYQPNQQAHQTSDHSSAPKGSLDETSKMASGWSKLRLVAKASADSLRGSNNSIKDDSRSQLGKGLSPVQRAQLDSSAPKDLNQLQQPSQQSDFPTTLASPISPPDRLSKSSSLERLPSVQSFELNPNAILETKKLTLTPDIARDNIDLSRSLNLSRQQSTSTLSADGTTSSNIKFEPSDPQVREEQEPHNSLDGHASQSIHSTDSNNGGSEEFKGIKRLPKKEESDNKKKKTGGLLSGFFGRKKDKKTKSDEESSSIAETDRPQTTSPTSPSDRSPNILQPLVQSDNLAAGTTPVAPQIRTKALDMFSTDAALKKQQVEAQEVMYRQYGISRQPMDIVNTTVFHSQMTNTTNKINNSTTAASTNTVASTTTAHLSSTHELSATLSPLSSAFSPVGSTIGTLSPPAGIRPGSLIGPSAIPGIDVPMLNVLRIFAGDNMDCDATFKTVLLSEHTTTKELIMQAMQRFRLASTQEDQALYYLTVKDVVSGEESKVDEHQMPLKVFELMNESLGQVGLSLPSVKRSSVGSISSVNSNLSLNPAISRLGMSDFSDDSAVKFYINRHPVESNEPSPLFSKLLGGLATIPPGRTNERSNSSLGHIKEAGSPSQMGSSDKTSDLVLVHEISPASRHLMVHDSDAPRGPNSPNSGGASNADHVPLALTSPSLRFAMRIQIFPSDLPDGLMFDPESNAIIPKSVLHHRGQRNMSNQTSTLLSPSFREKVMFFPRNINVSEAIEHTLEAFGIAEGVVDGGDDVEDKFSKRRSTSKVRYGLSIKTPNDLSDSQEIPVNLTSKVLDAYKIPPLFKSIDQLVKEARRRSLDHSFVLGSLQDLQPTDPIFILRRASPHYNIKRDSARSTQGSTGAIADDLSLVGSKKTVINSSTTRLTSQTHVSRPAISTKVSPAGNTAFESSANRILGAITDQKSFFQSVIRNSEDGLDLTLKDHTIIRSKKVNNVDQGFRYYYLDQNRVEFDISNLIESEWTPLSHYSQPVDQVDNQKLNRSPRRATLTSQNSISSFTEEGYSSAPESPLVGAQRLSPLNWNQDEANYDDEVAIEALREAHLSIDKDVSPIRWPRTQDLLALALEKERNNSLPDSSQLQQSRSPKDSDLGSPWLEGQICRILIKVKDLSGKPEDGHMKTETSQGVSNGVDQALKQVTDSDMVKNERAMLSTGEMTNEEVENEAADKNKQRQNSSQPSSGKGSTGFGYSKDVRSPQKTADAQLHSPGSSLSNSTIGSNSPLTPIMTTSPTGESTYTPISSATRGIGIDSRQSSHRFNPSSYHRDEFGLDIMMNLIQHSASMVEQVSHEKSLSLPQEDEGMVDGEIINSLDDEWLKELFKKESKIKPKIKQLDNKELLPSQKEKHKMNNKNISLKDKIQKIEIELDELLLNLIKTTTITTTSTSSSLTLT
ncbi:hypothetical protein O181_035305 [Austropuccinia psidii MF-1]|uniref:SH3 domain-containing protein n=1 Tax=Austropuccinia psidii MF-1 TaxID=1389203 RepID=A0A9Q3D6M5_9BASI|nr:hypothetical protein [Austropuccinia psidii MF-1]